MIGSGENVITTLRDRWQIAQEIQTMLDSRSQQEFTDRAQQVADSGNQVVPVLLGKLDTADARMLGALGVVASLYPQRQEILDSLDQAAADVGRPDRGRVSAMLILERFLGQEPDPYWIASLDDPRFMAVESIREMIRESRQDPRVLIQYTRSLAEQADEAIGDLLQTLLEVGGEDGVPALCLLAQEDDEAVGEAALSALGRLPSSAAARGLQSILPMLPPHRRALGERSLLKLRLKGVPIPDLSPAGKDWRTLVSPVDGEGHTVVWFLRAPDPEGRRRFLGLSIHELDGIRQAYGHYDVPVEMMPEQRLRGHVHSVLLPGPSTETGARLLMLETDFGYGRRLVERGQARTWDAGRPLPIEYRLMGRWLWEYSAPDSGAPGTDARPVEAGRVAPDPPVQLAESTGLLYHPAFRGWYAYGEPVLRHAAALLRRMPLATDATSFDGAPALIDELARAYFDRSMVDRLRGRLTAMSEWLRRAGEGHLAEVSSVAARALATTRPDRHPLTRGMVELGLQITLQQLRNM